MYTTILTIQGTITLPVALRRKYNLTPGDVLIVDDNGVITISKPPILSEVRTRNKLRLKGHTAPHIYVQGEGFEAYINEKYGKK